MSDPIIDVYMFEDALEQACSARAASNGLNKTKKQGDSGTLTRNWVEFKAVFGGWGPTANAPHMWVDGSGEQWPDTVSGKLYARCVTLRSDPDQNHARLRGTVRASFQDCTALSALMDWHKCEMLIESQGTPEISPDTDHDISALSFDVRLRILFDTKSSQIFPS